MKNKIDLIAAIVVGYFPNNQITYELLKSLAPQVDYLILIDNGGTETVYQQLDNEGIQLKYISFGVNKGLGYALNKGFEYAQQLGVEFVATFDQDSAPPTNFINNLKAVHLQLKEKAINCAAVGPIFYDRRSPNKSYFPFYKETNNEVSPILVSQTTESIVETDVLITSGMLIRMNAWNNGLHYRPDLFVDYTDTDWCFRARSQGYKLYGCTKIEMGHALSEAPPLKIFGTSFFHYSPLRRFYFFRNTLLICRQNYVSNAWRLRLLGGLFIRLFVCLLIDKKKTSSLHMMLKGIYQGLLNQSGEYKK